MDIPSDLIAKHAGINPYFNLGIYRGKVPSMPNVNFAIKGEMFRCAFYAYDVDNPTDKSQRIRIHQDAGVLGYYVIGSLGFRFQPVYKRDILIITGIGEIPIFYLDFLKLQQEEKFEKKAEKNAIKAEKKAREAIDEVRRVLAYAEQLEQEAIKARKYANKVASSK